MRTIIAYGWITEDARGEIKCKIMFNYQYASISISANI